MRILLALLTMMVVGVCYAESEGILNKLLAPGPLVKGHADLEGKDCLKCHDVGKGVSDKLCMDCHKAIRVFVEKKKGYHGLTTQSCRECHQDHKGRNFDSISVNQEKFDHSALTGYKLDGKHAEIKCEKCHVDKYGEKSVLAGKTRYLGKQATCVSCHKKDDIHFFKKTWAKKDCNACHATSSWKKDIRFDHEKDGHFKLVERHAEIKCSDCHGPNKKMRDTKYEWAGFKKAQCLSCHADFHKNNLSAKFRGGNCNDCHSQRKWEIPSFDHSVTKYPLRGKHSEIKCIDCHKQKPAVAVQPVKNFNFTGLKSDCLSCHKDYHKFGPHSTKALGGLNKCLSCHNEVSWKEVTHFDHNTDTRYPLDGKHLDLKCNECHVPAKMNLQVGIYKWPLLKTKTCEVCHKSPHGQEFSPALLKKACTECHVTTSWRDMKNGTSFDHSKTRFPLTGAHTQTRCADCHGVRPNQTFKFKSQALKFCIDCHKNVHVGQFSPKFAGNDCTACHSTKTFEERLPFDHSQTRYPLEGAHKNTKCVECHKPQKSAVLLTRPNFSQHKFPQGAQFHPGVYQFQQLKPKECLSCHKDYHAGQLDTKCLNCHSFETWQKPKFDHKTQSRFELIGKHQPLKCDECHKPLANKVVEYKNKKVPVIQYKPMGRECADCHKDVHIGQLEKKCSECHTNDSWRETVFKHNTQSSFELGGKHAVTKCSECHKPLSGQYVGFLSQGKIAQIQVVRYKPLTKACVDCHKDPHKGSFGLRCDECHSDRDWKITKDFHKNFTLSGVHYTLACAECHKDGRKLSGLSQDCLSCHAKDDVHSGSLPHCGECHRQQFWEISSFRHSMTRFPLRGAHRVIDCMDCHKTGTYQGLNSQCYACHLQDAISATAFSHTPIGNYLSCSNCHRNSFSFK
jgi:hypothetical protein